MHRLGPDSCNDVVIIRLQVEVAEILAGLYLPGARRIERCLGSLEGLGRLVAIRPSGVGSRPSAAPACDIPAPRSASPLPLRVATTAWQLRIPGGIVAGRAGRGDRPS